MACVEPNPTEDLLGDNSNHLFTYSLDVVNLEFFHGLIIFS